MTKKCKGLSDQIRVRLSLAYAFLAPLLCAGLFSGCMGPAPHLSDAQELRNPLQAFVTVVTDSCGRLQTAVEASVPRRALIFHNVSGMIQGGLEVTVTAWQAEQQVGGGVRRQYLQIPDWSFGQVDSLVTCVVPLVISAEGTVSLAVCGRSLETSKTWRRDLPHTVGRESLLPWLFDGFSWALGDSAEMTSAQDTLSCTIALRYGGPASDADQHRRGTQVGLRLSDYGAQQVFQQALDLTAVVLTTGRSQAGFTLPAGDLPFGSLRLTPYLALVRGTTTHERPWRPARSVKNLVFSPLDNTQWALQMDWLAGKFPDPTLADLRQLVPEARWTAWQDLWDTPAAALTHLRLILAADDRFSGPQRGSLSPRGMAWVRYGKPDRIQYTGSPDAKDSRSEIWHYNTTGLRLTFIDDHGLGDFRLQDIHH